MIVSLLMASARLAALALQSLEVALCRHARIGALVAGSARQLRCSTGIAASWKPGLADLDAVSGLSRWNDELALALVADRNMAATDLYLKVPQMMDDDEGHQRGGALQLTIDTLNRFEVCHTFWLLWLRAACLSISVAAIGCLTAVHVLFMVPSKLLSLCVWLPANQIYAHAGRASRANAEAMREQ
jgi:hypothetical protein